MTWQDNSHNGRSRDHITRDSKNNNNGNSLKKDSLKKDSSNSLKDSEREQLKQILQGLKDHEFNGEHRCKACSGFEDKILPRDGKGDVEEVEKHEILVRIADFLEAGPHGFAIAEDIFDEVKYQIARYVILFEFNKTLPLSTQLALWLDMKLQPKQRKRMERLIHHFFEEEKILNSKKPVSDTVS